MLTKRSISRYIRFRPAITIQRHHAAHYSETVRRHNVQEPKYIKDFRADNWNQILLDKAQLQVTFEIYNEIEKLVAQASPDDVRPELRLEKAGPHDYIKTSVANGSKLRFELLEALDGLKLHLKDFQTAPYREYDFDYTKITRSPAELEELDKAIRERVDQFTRISRVLRKYTDMMNEGSDRKEKDSDFKLYDFLDEQVARIENEEAGVEYADEVKRPVWVSDPNDDLFIPDPDQEAEARTPEVRSSVKENRPRFSPKESPGYYSLQLHDSGQESSSLGGIESEEVEVRYANKEKRPRFGQTEFPGERRLRLHEDQKPSTSTRRKAPEGRDSRESVPKQADPSDDSSDFPGWTDHESLLEADRKRR
ncbi:hypothetical protein MBLNU457_5910t1 [Dothideomycetes sp. NU457]